MKSAFTLDFTIVRIGNPIRGYVGATFRNDEDAIEVDQEIPRVGEPVETQGDGIRSYVGIAAEFVGSSHPVVLLDEPEAFLHPPQAKKLGNLVIDSLSEEKQYGLAAFSNGQERADAGELLELLRQHGIILLPAGEIESYVPDVGLHGPGWVSAVLDDFNAHEPKLRQLLSDLEPGLR